jgi:hypothetical protein
MDTLGVGKQLLPGESLISQDKRFTAILQGDGNFVVYRGSFPLWASNTSGKPVRNLIMQGDGNLVVYDPSGAPLWAAATNGNPGATFIMQNDGNAVIYLGSKPLWSTQTDGAGDFVIGKSSNPKFRGVYGENTGGGDGVFGYGQNQGRGVVGLSENHTGVEGNTTTGTGVWGSSTSGRGIAGWSQSFQGVYGHSETQAGVVGESDRFDGVYGISHNLQAAGVSGHNPGGLAGYFDGNLTVTGDIFLTGADCAEQFDVSAQAFSEPGTVMVMDSTGELVPSSHAYDHKVVGVVSGAGEYKAAIIMDRKTCGPRATIALLGKVYCKVDAESAPVETGDLMTTSTTPGHAMKATDQSKAFGTVIGKALRPMKSGKGLLPLLIAMQ